MRFDLHQRFALRWRLPVDPRSPRPQSRFQGFLGYRNDIGNVLALADVLALVSTRESFGLAIVEAMHAGLPVLATRCGGPEEIVVDGETGFLVDIADPPQIANRLQQLSNERLASELGEAGRLRAHALFGADHYVNGVRDLDARLSQRRLGARR
jgi:glycosyltransferase involved in cell wall biosynthesis